MIPAQNIQLYLPGGDEAGVRRAHFTRNSKLVFVHENGRRTFTGVRDHAMEAKWKNRRIIGPDGALLTKFARQQGWKLVGSHA